MITTPQNTNNIFNIAQSAKERQSRALNNECLECGYRLTKSCIVKNKKLVAIKHCWNKECKQINKEVQ